jgi:glycosyltransferase involved in cell wall biosynthesis
MATARMPPRRGVARDRLRPRTALVGQRPRYDIAIHAPFSAKLYAAGNDDAVDGAEVQAAMLARSLAARGLSVCHIVFDNPALTGARVDGVDLVRQEPDQLDRGRLAYCRSLFRALADADAAVYVQRTAGFETGLVGAFAKARGRPFIFSSSSRTDLSRKPPLPNWRASLSYKTGLRLADEIVVQTAEQADLARETLGREPRLIRSFCVARPPEASERRAFIWLGGLIDYKDPLAYTQLAERVPEAEFWMVGTRRGREWDALADRVVAEAERLPNLQLLPPRSRDRLFELYRQAVAVVNTSRFEGFPNTFMEGWSCGAPALSLNVDPDGVISRHRIGSVAGGDISALAAMARRLWAQRADLGELSSRTRRYIADHHDPDVIGANWEALIAERGAAS